MFVNGFGIAEMSDLVLFSMNDEGGDLDLSGLLLWGNVGELKVVTKVEIELYEG